MPGSSTGPQLPVLGFSSTFVPDKTINANRSLSYRKSFSKRSNFLEKTTDGTNDESGKYYLIGGLTPNLKVFPYVLSYRPDQYKLRFLKAYRTELEGKDDKRLGILSPVKESHNDKAECENEDWKVDPSNRAFHSTCLVGRFLLLFGGKDDKNFCNNQVFGLELESQDWRLIETLDNLDNLYGSEDLFKHIGEQEQTHIDKTKRKLGPKSRLGHTALSHPSFPDTTMVVFGGLTEDLCYTNDILTFTLFGKVDDRESISSLGLDGGTWNLIQPKLKLPKPRSGHTANLIDNDMVIFGGNDSKTYFNDLWVFKFEEITWKLISPTNTTSPQPRSGHATLYLDNFLYVLGGKDCNGNVLNDLWRFSFQELQWQFISSQTLAIGSGLFTSKVHLFNEQALIFGGVYDSTTKKTKFSISTLDLEDKWDDSDDDVTNDLSTDTSDSINNRISNSQILPFPTNFLDKIDTNKVNDKPSHYPKPSYQFDNDLTFTPIRGEFSEQKCSLQPNEPTNRVNDTNQPENVDQSSLDTFHFDPQDILDNRSICDLPVSPQKIPPTPLATSLDQDLIVITKLIDKLPELVLQDITTCYEAYITCLSDLSFLKGKVATLTTNQPQLHHNRLDSKITQLESSLLTCKSEVWKLKEDRNLYKELLCCANSRIFNLQEQLHKCNLEKSNLNTKKDLVKNEKDFIDTKLDSLALKGRIDTLEKQLRTRGLHLDKKQAQIELLEFENAKLKKENHLVTSQLNHTKVKCEMAEEVIEKFNMSDFLDVKGNRNINKDAKELNEVCKQIYNKLKLVNRATDPTSHLNTQLMEELEQSLALLHKTQNLNLQLLNELDSLPTESICATAPLQATELQQLQQLYQQLHQHYEEFLIQHKIQTLQLHQSQNQVFTLDQELQIYEARFQQLLRTNTEVKRRNKAALNAIQNLTNGQFTTNGLDTSFGIDIKGSNIHTIEGLKNNVTGNDFESWDDQVLQSLGIKLQTNSDKFTYSKDVSKAKGQLDTLTSSLKDREAESSNRCKIIQSKLDKTKGSLIQHTHSPSTPHSTPASNTVDMVNLHQRSQSKPQLTTNLYRNRDRSLTDVSNHTSKDKGSDREGKQLVMPLTSAFKSVQLTNTIQMHLTRHSKRYSSWVYRRYYN